MKRRNRQLGMDRDITRRDFLNGSSIALGGALLATPLSQASGCTPMQHALTQIPYVLIAALITIVGFLMLAYW